MLILVKWKNMHFEEFPRFKNMMETTKDRKLKGALIHLARNADRTALLTLEQHLDPSFEPKTPTVNPYEVPVQELGIDLQFKNALKRRGIENLGQLIERTEERVKAVRGLGVVGLKQIKPELKKRNLGFHSPYDLDFEVHELLHGGKRR